MTFYQELGTETMVCRGPHVRAVGWLSAKHPHLTGHVAEEVIERLGLFATKSSASSEALGFPVFLGVHECEFCTGHSAAANFGVPAGNLLYVAPEMVHHYVLEHGYQPPDEFVNALMTSADPGSASFGQAAKRFYDIQMAGLEKLPASIPVENVAGEQP